MTVLEVIRKSTEFLTRKGVDSPRLQVELLLAHVLNVPRLKLYLNFERTLTEKELEALRDLVKRRGEREPLQHILGSACFCGLDLKATRAALIPRPETEMLAERAWQFLKGLPESATPTVLDFGTGTGCIAIAIAVNAPRASVHALDVSPEALQLARENAEAHTPGRITFHAGNGFAALPKGLAFDLIVSNPPYIPAAEIASLQREVAEHDPRLALDGGVDGLDFYRRLAAEAPAFLRPNGRIMVEFGDGQAAAIRELFASPAWRDAFVENDYTRRERFFIATRVAS